MNNNACQNSNLWKCAFNSTHDKEFHEQISLLESSFFSMRDKASQLVGNIKSDFPDLTIHDITHLDALWEMADILCGDEIKLNPLETFIFGAAILIHDSALCFAAFNGQEQLRNEKYWKDYFNFLKRKKTNEDGVILGKEADFATIRKLHASQANKLIIMEWKFKGRTTISLLENSKLKNNLQQSIGKIAESHHWDIERVFAELKQKKPAPSEFPRGWTIDEQKIACLLRCADAMHIDDRRAPDFIYSLNKRSSVSHEHWTAQNNLTPPSSDNGELYYHTKNPFSAQESSSWWQALDLLKIIDNEIKSVNKHLAQGGTPFALSGVHAIDDLTILQTYIEAEGWAPYEVSIHTNNIQKIVRDLGGEQLYGKSCNKLYVVARELIQNARDAVIARSKIDPSFTSKGSILISMEENDGRTWLHVFDNGVGMSERTLTTTLLDFSSSFWSSESMINEFEGLSSSSFKSVGQYGVGFYSTFMLADKVEVSTKKYDKGHNDVNSLSFNDGLSLRPIFKRSASEAHKSKLSSFQTCVSILVKKSEGNIYKQFVNSSSGDKTHVDFEDFLARLCCGLDVKVKLNNSGSIKLIHDPESKQNDREKWCNKISYAKYTSDINKFHLKRDIKRMRPIEDNGVRYGYASIATIANPQSAFIANSNKTVGGFSSYLNAMPSEYFTGYIEYESEQANRAPSGKTLASPEVMHKWADEQLSLLKTEGPDSQLVACSYLPQWQVNPSAILHCAIVDLQGNQHLTTLAGLVVQAMNTGLGFVGSSLQRGNGNYIDSYAGQGPLDDLYRVLPYPFNSKYHSLELTEDNIPSEKFSLIWCIHEEATKQNKTLTWERVSDYKEGYGTTLDLVILKIT